MWSQRQQLERALRLLGFHMWDSLFAQVAPGSMLLTFLRRLPAPGGLVIVTIPVSHT